MSLPAAAIMLLALPLSTAAASGPAGTAAPVPADVGRILEGYCVACHGPKKQEGTLRFDQLATLARQPRTELASRIVTVLESKDMPPEDARPLPPEAATRLLAWAKGEAGPTAADADKLRLPRYANHIDHAMLFDGSVKAAPFTPARRWLVSPQIFRERVIDVFQLTGRERELAGNNLVGVTNPFVLPDHSGVRDYDLTALDGGHLLLMLGNAEWIAGKQIHAARVKSGEIKADAVENPKDKWFPKTTPAALEAIIVKKTPASDAEITAAVRTQFDAVLRRGPSADEAKKYLALTRRAIDAAGNTEGLRHMLRTVLLESEFLYRLEFGAGPADAHGRRMLAPREGAFALAYALGDKGPDAALVAAAREGRLSTREDYRREVTRLLADKTGFRGPVDPALSGMHIRSHVVSHPKVIRFFREFFGYTGAVKVFKDVPRSDGWYQNPDRGHLGSPGWLVQEADEFVITCVERDARVFEALLTSDRFFVYHNMDADAGRKLIARWRNVYETLKSEPWRTDPDAVMQKHAALLRAEQIIDSPKNAPDQRATDRTRRNFLSYMLWFEDTLGRGRTPFTRPPFSHGYQYYHSQAYSLPPTPGAFLYGEVAAKAAKTSGPGPDRVWWDYPLEQPFPIENRKGILTHPAWLIAHSQNSATDPVRRGLWIREKLLAGHVPDVPITVDAQIPENPHKTLRERLDAATGKAECMRCHRHMNPLGLPFESFDDFGRYRKVESLEHPENVIAKAKGKYGADTYKTKPVDPRGHLSGTGEAALDGEVKDAFDLIDRLARSARVRQSIIRHAFRFFMGRNELASDSATLIDADRAYVSSGGSFRAVIVSLLTSDSFLYRK